MVKALKNASAINNQKISHQILELFFFLNPALRLAYRYYRFMKSNPAFLKSPQQTALGFKFNGNAQMERGSFEPHETELIKRLIQEVDTVVNVGANIGYYVCLALYCGKSIVAFEPIPDNLHFLLRNIMSNGWEARAKVFPMALSNKVGILEIYGRGTGASLIEGWSKNSADDVLLVPVSTLDVALGNQLNNQKALIIVDIEGAEKMMLDGACRLLAIDPKPIWFMEITAYQHQPANIKVNPYLMATFEKFWDLGYQSWNVGESIKEITRADIERLIALNGAKDESPNYLFAQTREEIIHCGVVINN